VRQHPKEALHRIQLARALLSAGLAENARTVARQATALEPNSAQAYSTLAWILEHDLIGRRLKKGYDLQGAIVAYRKAKELDPKDKDIRANLAMLLEYDSKATATPRMPS
jgi:Flp pilus assembly protein TadD, contains TPR repeats